MSSLNNIVKISSNQGGVIHPQNPLVDFTIPAGTVYDLSKSYVNLNCSIDAANADGTVYTPVVRFLEDDLTTVSDAALNNVAIVRNMNMSCRSGRICNVRRVDALRQNLNEYTMTTSEKKSSDYQGLVTSWDNHQQLNSIFREIRREGNQASSNNNGDVRIPLSQLCNFGNVQQFSTDIFGEARLHLELNLNRVNVSQYQSSTATTGWSNNERNTCTALSATVGADLKTLYGAVAFEDLADSPYHVNQRVLISGTKYDGDVEGIATHTLTNAGTTGYTTGESGNFTGGTGSGATFRITTATAGVITAIAITDSGKNYSPNDVLTIPGGDGTGRLTVNTVDTGTAITKTTTINSIEYPLVDAAPKEAYKPVLSLADALDATALTGTETIQALSVVGVDTTFTFTCNFGEIVLEEVVNGPPAPNQITYTEYVAEEYTSAGVSSFQRQFTLEPECMNLFVVKPDSILSKLGDVTQWRLRLNNKDLTNRPVIYDSPLSLDRISMSLGDANERFKNSNQLYQTVDASTNTPGENYKAGSKLLLITNPMPITQQEKQLQLNIQATAATITDLILYKQCVRSLKA
tara:strand:+ start:79 stop:1812 length:1734 start_codon:yes stop_codon:yes gene_type:complete